MRRLILALALLLAATAAAAQEFDIFDQNDFIDPRQRGASFDAGGFGVTDPGSDFSVLRAYTGHVSNYQWRNTPTNQEVNFVQLAHSFYRDRRQLNLKLTFLDAAGRSDLPAYRGTVQYGSYFAVQPAEGSNDGQPARQVASRWLVSAAFEQNAVRSRDASGRSLNYELAAEMDVLVPLRRANHNIIGSLIFVDRRAIDHSQRLTYFYHVGEKRHAHGLRVTMNLGAGGERTDHWRWGSARAVVNASIDAGRIATINFAYAPTYVPHDPAGRRVHHEITLYLDRTVMAHLTARK
jgi:hypothetical protein